MKVQILGSGCDKCKKLAANAQEAAVKLGLPCEIEKVTDINEITAYGVMMTPALVIDGKVVSVGKVLSPDEAAKLMQPGAPQETPAPQETAAAAESPCCCCGGGGRAKKWLTAVLLLFVAASVAFVIVREIRSRNAAPTTPAAVAPEAGAVPVKAVALTVYYFHGNQRCMTCNKIEELARAAIVAKYAKEIADGAVAFRSINVEEPANEHFIKDFQLASRTVVMAKNGKYETFDAVWTLVRDPQKFTAYIQDGAARMMGAK